MLNGLNEQRELSFYTNIMRFIPGQGFVFEEASSRRQLENLEGAGSRWVGVNFPNLEEPCEPDARSCAQIFKGWLDELGFRVTSCHYDGPTYCSPEEGQDQATRHMTRTVEMMAPLQPASVVVHAAWPCTGCAPTGLRSPRHAVQRGLRETPR